MRAHEGRRTRRGVAWALLASAVALLLLPSAALAESRLVAEYRVPREAAAGDDQSDDWYVSVENYRDEPVFRARTLRGADGFNDLDWSATGEVDARVVGRGYSADAHLAPFTSFEDFAARSPEIEPGEDYLYRTMESPSLRTWEGARRTTLGGLDAYVNRSTVRLEYSEEAGNAEYGDAWVYWIPAGSDSGILVTAFAAVTWSERVPPTSGAHHGDQLGPLAAEVESVLASLRFHPLDGTSTGTTAPGADEPAGGLPWRTVTGGIAAVAAAAIALAGAAASARARTPGREDPAPGQPVGHLLQLSTGRLTVSAEHATPLTAQAFQVLADGSFRPASDTVLILHPPTGVAAQPPSGHGTLRATISQAGAVAPGASLLVEARAPLGGTTAAIPVLVAGVSRIVTRLEPDAPLRTQGGAGAVLAAVVELLSPDTEDPALSEAAVQSTIVFEADSEWLDLSVPVDRDGGRAVTVLASQPDPTAPVPPPEQVAVRVSAQLGERMLTEIVAIPLEPLPEIDARPDSVTLAAESGASVEVEVRIAPDGGAGWSFETEWREGARLIASPEIRATGPATATLTITESAGDRLELARPQTASTLVVVATAAGFEPLRREVQVIVGQEGLFADRATIDPATGAFAVRADGSAVATEIDLRVFVRDATSGEMRPEIELATSVVLEPGGEDGTVGRAGLRAGALAIEFAGVRPANVPSATFRVAIQNALPTGAEPLPAALVARVPGLDGPKFSAVIPLRLLGVDTEPFSAAWQTELDGCLRVIATYVPAEHRDRLYALVHERSRTMGAEGLYQMRRTLWGFAHDQLLIEKHEHLDAAWWNEQIEGTLDWVSWCGDIALGVVSGTAIGVIGSLALGMLKPLLVSAMEAWLRGDSLEGWLLSQSSLPVDTLEGVLVDPDILATLTADKKAIAWALFIAYHFGKALYNDPELSVTNAMKRVCQQVRDEGLIRFLRMVAGMKGRSPDTLKPAADAPAKPAAGARSAAPDTPAGPTPKRRAGPDLDAPSAEKRPAEQRPAEKRPAERTRAKAGTREGTPAERAARMADDLASQARDGRAVDRATVERILTDPDAMRELRRRHPDQWREMHRTRSEIYRAHDEQLAAWVSENVPEAKGREVAVESVGTPDGVDRDYRVGYVTSDPVTGQRRFIEIRKERWAGESQRIFAQETGGPTDPRGARAWARDHQQLATDMYHAEASVDMADQGTVYNEQTGRWEKTQVTPNVDLVTAGRSTLLDPEGLGSTYRTKVADSYHAGNPLDAYRQADKAVHTLEGVSDGYARQGYGVKEPPAQIRAGMDVIRDVQAGRLTPDAADAKLRGLGCPGGLPDFMEKLAGQFGRLKWARKP